MTGRRHVPASFGTVSSLAMHGEFQIGIQLRGRSLRRRQVAPGRRGCRNLRQPDFPLNTLITSPSVSCVIAERPLGALLNFIRHSAIAGNEASLFDPCRDSLYSCRPSMHPRAFARVSGISGTVLTMSFSTWMFYSVATSPLMGTSVVPVLPAMGTEIRPGCAGLFRQLPGTGRSTRDVITDTIR